MLYRRKILLAVIEAFGGSLTQTDCRELLYLFCARRNKNYYDFFCSEYRRCSFTLSHDKKRLTDLGFLTAQEHFQLSSPQSFLSQISAQDRAVLQALAVDDVESHLFERRVCSDYSLRNTTSVETLFTIGYEGLSIDAYLNVLLSNQVSALIDVRKNPLSMKYGFSKTKLAQYINSVGILYIHLPQLGIPSALRRDLKSSDSYQKLFDYYLIHMLPEQVDSIEILKELLHDQRRVALTCFEADYHFCHRHKIVEYLKNNLNIDVPIIHLNKSCTNVNPIKYTDRDNTFPHSYAGNTPYALIGGS